MIENNGHAMRRTPVTIARDDDKKVMSEGDGSARQKGNNDNCCPFHGLVKHHHDKRGYHDRGDHGQTRHNQPNDQRSTAGHGGSARSVGDMSRGPYGAPARPAKYS